MQEILQKLSDAHDAIGNVEGALANLVSPRIYEVRQRGGIAGEYVSYGFFASRESAQAKYNELLAGCSDEFKKSYGYREIEVKP